MKFFVFASPEHVNDSSPPLAVGIQFEVSRVTSANGLLALPVQAVERFKRHKCFLAGVPSLLPKELATNTHLHQTTENYFNVNKL